MLLLKHRRVRVTSTQTEHVIVSTQAYVKQSSSAERVTVNIARVCQGHKQSN